MEVREEDGDKRGHIFRVVGEVPAEEKRTSCQ
jgi:hypothetical protein